MRFKEQVRWSLKWGACLSVLAGALIALMFLIGEPGKPDLLPMTVGYLGGTALFCSIVLLAFGVVGRSAHRWIYLQSNASLLAYPRITVRQRFTEYWDAGFWRWWLHIDSSGNDRDA